MPGYAASALDADVAARILEFMKELEAECGQISASQAEILARAHCIGAVEEEGEAEVSSTPPLTQQDPQRQGQSQRGQAGEGKDGIAMCSMPFTQTQPSSPSSASSDSRERKPTQAQSPSPSPSPSPELDPLVSSVLMVPTAPVPTTDQVDILELARSRNIF